MRERATRDLSVRVDNKETRRWSGALRLSGGGGDSSGGGEGAAASTPAELVSAVLERIEGTNRGVDCSLEQREEIDGLIEQVTNRLPPSFPPPPYVPSILSGSDF